MLTIGDTATVLVVAVVFQTYDTAPLAVKVAEAPIHTAVLVVAMVKVGKALTDTVLMAGVLLTQPLVPVPITE